MDHMCQYSNCHETDTPVLLSVSNEDPKVRKRFCSLAHAALWARKEVKRNTDRGWLKIAPEDAQELGI